MSETADVPFDTVVEESECRVDEAVTGKSCVVCGSPSTTQPTDPRPIVTPGNQVGPLPVALPMLQLCDEHWSAYRTDWLLLGWCVDHYAEALRYCDRHAQEVPPL